MPSNTREQWLNNAAPMLARLIETAGYKMPELVRYSCGWPSKGGLAKKKRVVGQCWDSGCSKDKTFEVFVAPTVSKPTAVLETQLHEMIHAAVGLACKHKGDFKKCALAVGFESPMTETPASKELTLKLMAIAGRLGAYPHASLEGQENSGPPKQGTRMVKCECPSCGYIVRTTRKWIDEVGLPVCACGSEFAEDGADTDESDE